MDSTSKQNQASIDIIEHSKENIEPRRQGHSASAISKAFSKDHEQKYSNQLHEERANFEKKLQVSDEEEDPLQIWIDYIQWTLNSYPQGNTTESGLLSLLERCSQHFIKVPVYKNDIRYLRIWMQYAKYVDDPAELFSFLSLHEIGTNFSLYYEEFASYYESKGSYKKAEEIYQKGFLRKAKPFARFQERYHQFVHRRVIYAPDTISTSPTNEYPPLQTTYQASSLQPKSRSNEDSIPEARKFSVFSDAEAIESQNGKFSNPSSWEAFGTVEQKRKENTIPSRAWVGEILHTQSSRKVDPLDNFSVYQDETSSH
ncbi:mitotic spindle checkpoint protein Mad3 [Schizosaccharomyces cryophilus OY26]|uniref:Mitotic spindle checkpoint protein Mad3 n=1 Tax=Schizosaccharomyces cryophilus (strain OY26 / ATCC MYA-4695 / CBS 11777 / NBRC 106824 / NRRL Y48691) TaxID=653667 RepID=S9VU87_SCHCR|nr:mitotic spindle checkpoint protein Mad3 [Schizosaccharomyces cryophilus OY26]EPY49744.1 mitotic spindle checkpoint protein Mad3 [Schizosaccharomyces cryophilus OY26]